MKNKAAITEGAPEDFVKFVDSPAFAKRIYHDVLKEKLGVVEMGPAEFYVQHSDRTVAFDNDLWGCEVRLTGVSVKPGRDFHGALEALVKLYTLAIQDNVPHGKSVQLFVVIMLDGIPEGHDSALFESAPVWVDGSALDHFVTNPTRPGMRVGDGL